MRLAIAALLFSLLAVAPASAQQDEVPDSSAEPAITLADEAGLPGSFFAPADVLTVIGRDFPPTFGFRIEMTSGADVERLGAVNADQAGDFYKQVTLPENLEAGQASVVVRGAGISARAIVNITVLPTGPLDWLLVPWAVVLGLMAVALVVILAQRARAARYARRIGVPVLEVDFSAGVDSPVAGATSASWRSGSRAKASSFVPRSAFSAVRELAKRLRRAIRGPAPRWLTRSGRRRDPGRPTRSRTGSGPRSRHGSRRRALRRRREGAAADTSQPPRPSETVRQLQEAVRVWSP